MLIVRKPSPELLRHYVAVQSPLEFTYAEVGATASSPPSGYVVDHTRIELGQGEEVYQRARCAFEHWKQFDMGWLEAWPTDTPIRAGETVAVIVRAFGLWWLNAAANCVRCRRIDRLIIAIWFCLRHPTRRKQPASVKDQCAEQARCGGNRLLVDIGEEIDLVTRHGQEEPGDQKRRQHRPPRRQETEQQQRQRNHAVDSNRNEDSHVIGPSATSSTLPPSQPQRLVCCNVRSFRNTFALDQTIPAAPVDQDEEAPQASEIDPFTCRDAVVYDLAGG